MSTSIENQIFTWENHDLLDNDVIMFYDVELVVDVGDFPVGKKFPTALLNANTSSITLFDNDEDETGHSYEFTVSVGKKL